MPNDKSRIIVPCLSLLLLLAIMSGSSTHAAKRDRGEQLYGENCEACHRIGKNIINPEKTILGSNELETLPRFKSFLSHANGQMPAYKTIVRNDKDLKALYDYIKNLNKSLAQPEAKQSTAPPSD